MDGYGDLVRVVRLRDRNHPEDGRTGKTKRLINLAKRPVRSQKVQEKVARTIWYQNLLFIIWKVDHEVIEHLLLE